jgi:hypothetical protein
VNDAAGPNEAAEERPPRYIVLRADRTEQDRDTAFLRFLRHDPAYAQRWLEGLDYAIAGLPNFPGPRSHPKEEEASDRLGVE